MRHDEQVDMLEMKSYGEINVDETPIVVLGCGHFFTAETLDGMVGIAEVYEIDKLGNIVGLKDISSALAQKIPSCPYCKQPIRQYVTQRYNRVINRAVIDEMSKRFIVSGQTKLQELETEVAQLAQDLETSRSEFSIPTNGLFGSRADVGPAFSRKIKQRYEKSSKIEKKLQVFQKEFADRHQPAQKLHEATVYAAKKNAPIEDALTGLSLDRVVPIGERDRRILLGGQMLRISAICTVLEDKFYVASKAGSSARIEFPRGSPKKLVNPSLDICEKFIKDCTDGNLPKLAVEATLYYARIARSYGTSTLTDEKEKEQASTYRDKAKHLLEEARDLCKQPFQNADKLALAVEDSIKMLRREWYEEVTPEELAAIKQAMVSGSRGIATHSGHWYNCERGHPVIHLSLVPFYLLY